MRSPMHRLSAVVALVLVAAACGSDDATTAAPESTAAPTTAAESTAAPTTAAEPAAETEAQPQPTPDAAPAPDSATQPVAGTGDVPDLDMVDVSTDATVNLQSLVDGQTPLLLWFWAPH